MLKIFVKLQMFILIILLVSFKSTYVFSAPQKPEIKAASAILMETKRGQILYKKNANERLHISSACKIMTSLITLEKLKLDSKVTISKGSVYSEGSTVGLEAGNKYTVEELVSALLLLSANDAANALAEYIGGDVSKFVEKMNVKASEINLKNTLFKNATGLYDETQYTTAEDVAVLVRYALANPEFNKLFALRAFPWEQDGNTRILVNQNKLFWSYEGVDGGRVGYNEKEKQTAITTATRNNQRLLAIVLDAFGDAIFEDSVKLFNYGFEEFKLGTLVSKGELLKREVVGNQTINLISINDVYYTFPIGDNYIKKVNFVLDKKLKLPIMKDQKAGVARYTLKDDTVIDVSLYSDKDIFPSTSIYLKILKRVNEYEAISYILIFLIALEIFLIISKLAIYLKRFKK